MVAMGGPAARMPDAAEAATTDDAPPELEMTIGAGAVMRAALAEPATMETGAGAAPIWIIVKTHPS